jgi:hypothetical protein
LDELEAFLDREAQNLVPKGSCCHGFNLVRYRPSSQGGCVTPDHYLCCTGRQAEHLPPRPQATSLSLRGPGPAIPISPQHRAPSIVTRRAR